jgi:N-acetylmuramoyl-L-alanine amidase
VIPILSRRNEFKIRQKILRGVYEENLFMLGKGHPAWPRRRPFHRKRILLPALFCFIAVLVPMGGHYTGSSFAPAEPTPDMTGVLAELTPNMSTNTFPLPKVDVSLEGSANTPDFSSFVNSSNVPFSRMLGLKIKRIMIDPGHGGDDSGCVGKFGTKEKDITLDIAKRLKTHLVKNNHYHVFMTRKDDSSVTLLERVALVKETKADLFISIHVNFLPNHPINIIETYYFGPSHDKKILMLAEQENAGSEYGLSDFKEVVEKLGKTMKLQESKEFAESIQANLFMNSRKHSENIKDYGVKRAPFVVLLGVAVPCVLAEVSCLSNPEEERKLNSENHREDIASYLATGIFDYMNKGAFTYEVKR